MTVSVPLVGQRDASYDILIERGLLKQLPALVARHCPGSAYAVITDSHVARLYGEDVVRALQAAGLVTELCTFPAGEENKTRDTWAAVSDRLLGAGLARDGVVIALGGGVVGDMAGFVAATYLRGVRTVVVPTTLLAMIDSSIGGKTGVDTPAGKNLVGAFHQPTLVLVDLDALASLPARQLAAGMAEAVKHGAIADAAYFNELERDHRALLAGDPVSLDRAVTQSVRIKAAIVAADEREAGRRAILNFGHTIGHAIEATSRYSLLHGEAVAIGMALEATLAERAGISAVGTAGRITDLLRSYGLPLALPDGTTADALLAVMRYDKKSRDGELRFALPTRIGSMYGDAERGWTVPVAVPLLRQVLTAESC